MWRTVQTLFLHDGHYMIGTFVVKELKVVYLKYNETINT